MDFEFKSRPTFTIAAVLTPKLAKFTAALIAPPPIS